MHDRKYRNFTYFLVWKFCGKAQFLHSIILQYQLLILLTFLSSSKIYFINWLCCLREQLDFFGMQFWFVSIIWKSCKYASKNHVNLIQLCSHVLKWFGVIFLVHPIQGAVENFFSISLVKLEILNIWIISLTKILLYHLSTISTKFQWNI